MKARADLVIGVALTALALGGTLGPHGEWLDTVLIPAVTLPVVWRRRAPLACAAAFSAGVVVSALPTLDQWRCGVAIPAGLLILYSLGTRAERRVSIAGLALVLGGMAFLTFTDPLVSPAVLTWLAPLCAGVWAAGRFVRSRGRLAAQLAERSAELERRREQTAALAVQLERTRLSAQLDAATRERVQAMIELTERGDVPDVFARIERAGRESLNEMRDLLGVLRSDGKAVRSPQPTLVQLEALLATARARFDVEGEPRALPEGVELAAYRVVEHALAALRGPVTVCLRYRADAVELEVGGADGGGDALAAARERAAAHGGSLAVRTDAGRIVVLARLPLPVAHA